METTASQSGELPEHHSYLSHSLWYVKCVIVGKKRHLEEHCPPIFTTGQNPWLTGLERQKPTNDWKKGASRNSWGRQVCKRPRGTTTVRKLRNPKILNNQQIWNDFQKNDLTKTKTMSLAMTNLSGWGGVSRERCPGEKRNCSPEKSRAGMSSDFSLEGINSTWSNTFGSQSGILD